MLVKKLSKNATLPKRCSEFAAGYDLYSSCELVIKPSEYKLVQTDISIAIPEGTYGRIAPRSGLAVKNGIDVLAGVVDYDYRGPVGVILINHSKYDFTIKVGDRIAQLVLEKIETPEVKETDDLPSTVRSSSGFGSTGL
jgi:dUTP pyrophosphatase